MSTINNAMRYHELFDDEIIQEMPLPVDWDKDVYKPSTTYAKRIAYTAERASKLGKGSSRSAFAIDIGGKASVLKVAHNAKGLAQNNIEADVLSDGYIEQLGIVIPIIDYDTEHEEPLWLNVERAQKASESQLCKMMRCPALRTLVGAAQDRLGNGNWAYQRNRDDAEIEKYGEGSLEIFNEYADKLAELGGYDIDLMDFTYARNWGIYDGRPVVIDVGFSSSVKAKYYS